MPEGPFRRDPNGPTATRCWGRKAGEKSCRVSHGGADTRQDLGCERGHALALIWLRQRWRWSLARPCRFIPLESPQQPIEIEPSPDGLTHHSGQAFARMSSLIAVPRLEADVAIDDQHAQCGSLSAKQGTSLAPGPLADAKPACSLPRCLNQAWPPWIAMCAGKQAVFFRCKVQCHAGRDRRLGQAPATGS